MNRDILSCSKCRESWRFFSSLGTALSCVLRYLFVLYRHAKDRVRSLLYYTLDRMLGQVGFEQGGIRTSIAGWRELPFIRRFTDPHKVSYTYDRSTITVVVDHFRQKMGLRNCALPASSGTIILWRFHGVCNTRCVLVSCFCRMFHRHYRCVRTYHRLPLRPCIYLLLCRGVNGGRNTLKTCLVYVFDNTVQTKWNK